MKKFGFLLFFVFSISIAAQQQNSQPYIEVTGTAKTEIVPDEIYLDICIKERVEKGKKLSVSFLEKELKMVLNEIGIPENNLAISDMNNILSKTGLWKKEVLSFTNYTLKIRGIDNLKHLFNRFKTLKIFSINITKATHSNIIMLKKQNRIKAIKVAQEKGSYLLSAIGEELGKPIKINEVNKIEQNNYANNIRIRGLSSNYNNYSKGAIGYGINDKAVDFEKIKITSSIYVKFLIK